MTSNRRWKARLAKSLSALRPVYGGGSIIYRTTIAKSTLAKLQATVPFGGGSSGLGGPVTDTALRLFLALVSPDAHAVAELGKQLGIALEAHPDLVERISESLFILTDNLHIRDEITGEARQA